MMTWWWLDDVWVTLIIDYHWFSHAIAEHRSQRVTSAQVRAVKSSAFRAKLLGDTCWIEASKPQQLQQLQQLQLCKRITSGLLETTLDHFGPLWTTFLSHLHVLLLFIHVRQREFQDSSPSSEISSPLERCPDTWQILASFKAVSASFSCFGCFGSMLSMSQDQTQTFSLTSDNQGIWWKSWHRDELCRQIFVDVMGLWIFQYLPAFSATFLQFIHCVKHCITSICLGCPHGSLRGTVSREPAMEACLEASGDMSWCRAASSNVSSHIADIADTRNTCVFLHVDYDQCGIHVVYHDYHGINMVINGNKAIETRYRHIIGI